MNSYERMTRRLRGDAVDRPPNFNIMMTFAAHHIGQPLSRYYQDYRVLCEANFAVQQDFRLDIVQAISDPYREAADFGLSVEFPEDGLPVKWRVPLAFSSIQSVFSVIRLIVHKQVILCAGRIDKDERMRRERRAHAKTHGHMYRSLV